MNLVATVGIVTAGSVGQAVNIKLPAVHDRYRGLTHRVIAIKVDGPGDLPLPQGGVPPGQPPGSNSATVKVSWGGVWHPCAGRA
jgi:hypothetical protein